MNRRMGSEKQMPSAVDRRSVDESRGRWRWRLTRVVARRAGSDGSCLLAQGGAGPARMRRERRSGVYRLRRVPSKWPAWPRRGPAQRVGPTGRVARQAYDCVGTTSDLESVDPDGRRLTGRALQRAGVLFTRSGRSTRSRGAA